MGVNRIMRFKGKKQALLIPVLIAGVMLGACGKVSSTNSATEDKGKSESVGSKAGEKATKKEKAAKKKAEDAKQKEKSQKEKLQKEEKQEANSSPAQVVTRPDANSSYAVDQSLQQPVRVSKDRKAVCIDPGHQACGNNGVEPVGPGGSQMKTKVAGGTRGTTTGIPEYQLTLDVSLKLKAELERRGYTVYLTRSTNDVNITNAERAQYANSCGACAYIRLHADGAQSSSASGASAFYPSRRNPFVAGLSDASASVSTCVMNGYLAATGMRSRGVGPRDDLSGSNWSQIPVTLLEMGFMTNPSDDVNMANEAFQEKMVRGIADGLDAYFAY